ncbi:DUF4332 domain-containing protein [Rosistilla oblonga]|uniref:DUF4332 domain-containing protein n=1 Tax=Rosistilla oblonga TaxID=2527990 RepID=UPI003A97F54F
MRNFIAKWFRKPDHPVAPQRAEAAPIQRSKPRTARQRRMEASLASLRLLPPSLVRQLESHGLVSVKDLLNLNLTEWASERGLSKSHQSQLRTVRRAIRMAMSLRVMHPRDAYLLIAIHRRSPEDVASDSPRHLFRDLERFALSSRGRALMRRIEFPSIDRVATWISAAQDHQFSHLATSQSGGASDLQTTSHSRSAR